jgi:hypothetical protein
MTFISVRTFRTFLSSGGTSQKCVRGHSRLLSMSNASQEVHNSCPTAPKRMQLKAVEVAVKHGWVRVATDHLNDKKRDCILLLML